MKAWIRRSFKNRIFVTVLSVTLLMVLFCNVVMMQFQLNRIEADLALETREELDDINHALENAFSEFQQIADTLNQSIIAKSALRRSGNDSRLLYQQLFEVTKDWRAYARFDIFDPDGICLYTTNSTTFSESLPVDWGILYAAGGTETLTFLSGSSEAIVCGCAIRTCKQEVLGYFVISMTQQNLEDLLEGLYSPPNILILLDSHWRTIYYSQSPQIETTVEQLRSLFLEGESLDTADPDSRFFYRGQFRFRLLSYPLSAKGVYCLCNADVSLYYRFHGGAVSSAVFFVRLDSEPASGAPCP